MRNTLVIIFIFVFASSAIKAQYQGLNNLDTKYGFNKFKLEESFSKYNNSCKFLYTDEDGAKVYLYNGTPIEKVFGYFDLQELHLYFYKDVLSKIEIEFGYLTKENERFILNELIKLYDVPQKQFSDEYMDFFYAWLSGKTSLYFQKYKMKNSTPTNATIIVSSFKIVMEIKNSKF
jgi:hypothetical protein